MAFVSLGYGHGGGGGGGGGHGGYGGMYGDSFFTIDFRLLEDNGKGKMV